MTVHGVYSTKHFQIEDSKQSAIAVHWTCWDILIPYLGASSVHGHRYMDSSAYVDKLIYLSLEYFSGLMHAYGEQRHDFKFDP